MSQINYPFSVDMDSYNSRPAAVESIMSLFVITLFIMYIILVIIIKIIEYVTWDENPEVDENPEYHVKKRGPNYTVIYIAIILYYILAYFFLEHIFLETGF